MNFLKRIWEMPFSYLDRQDAEERLTFNVLVGRHLRDITAVIGLLEIVYSGLAFIDRLNPTRPSNVYYVEILSNSSFWAGAFLLSGIVVAVSLKRMELRASAMAISSGCLLVWGVVIFFKALTAIEPVALSVGITGFTVGVIAYKACLSWNVIMFNNRYFTREDVMDAKALDTANTAGQ